ncbi:hypothetical protein H4R19_002372 [Coemansia spiralis]|nr:hypothetical protein H4R19_002372 [Coemansia spiralis]
MDNLENDILELFESDAGAGRSSERGRGDSRSKPHAKRHRQSRRDEYSGSDDMDMDTDEDVDIEESKDDAYAQQRAAASDSEPLDEWGEDLMGDHKDRRWLASLAEVERERILAERQEKRDILNEQRELRMKLKAGVRVSAAEASGRATRASRSKRADAPGRGAGSLSDLKRERERRRRQGDTDRWSSSPSDGEESEHESDPSATLDEINTICLPRNLLEQWLFRPFLAEAIAGCFVRIVTRIKDSTGEYNQYKMMEIVDVVQGEGRNQPPYHLNKTLTDKYLTLRFGATEKDYSMETISNSHIKPEEHSSWEAALRADRVRGRTTAGHVQKKLDGLERARNYQLSEAEVSQMIAERNRLRQIGSSGGSGGVGAILELSQLNQLRTDARQNADWGQLKKIEARLEELNKLSGATAKGETSGVATPTAHRSLLAPSTSRTGGTSTTDNKGAVATRRAKLLTPSSATNRPLPTIAAKLPGNAETKFALVPELRVQELSLRAKVTSGYTKMMAENGGYDMGFLSLLCAFAMCGIQVAIRCPPTSGEVSRSGNCPSVRGALLQHPSPTRTCSSGLYSSHVGPDAHGQVSVTLLGAELHIGAHVLHLRGTQPQPQPLVAEGSGDILCWNGEVFGGIDMDRTANDSARLLAELQREKSQRTEGHVLRVFQRIEGPYAFAYLDRAQNALWYARDYLGRRSLLVRADGSGSLLLSSVAEDPCDGEEAPAEPWVEVPAQAIYCLDLSDPQMAQLGPPAVYEWRYAADAAGCAHGTERAYLELPFGRVKLQPSANAMLLDTAVQAPPLDLDGVAALPSYAEWQPYIDRLELALTTAIRERTESIPRNTSPVRVGVLFSGGVDCMVIAALLSKVLPRSEPIELFNVAFENPRQAKLRNAKPFDVPDRKTGVDGWHELQRCDPAREWRFVEVDVPYAEAVEHSAHIRRLLTPASTVMDMSIGMAIWFASRGRGHLVCTTNGEPARREYVGRARVLLLGMGADEQLGGYSRHRTAWDRGGWELLGHEIDLDVQRIATRNLGRDDRIVSDNAKEARFPFLAAGVVRFLSETPLDRKIDMRCPRGVGEKLLLRLLARRLGLVHASSQPKRAIQFGARTAKMDSGQTKGQDTL